MIGTDNDFRRMFEEAARPTTIQILYYRPDHSWLLQEFIWQTLDTAPRFPRMSRFLEHWHREIEAVIKSVELAHDDIIRPFAFRPISFEGTLSH